MLLVTDLKSSLQLGVPPQYVVYGLLYSDSWVVTLTLGTQDGQAEGWWFITARL